MVNEFLQITKIIENLNLKCNALNSKDIEKLKYNMSKFAQEKNKLLYYMHELSSISKEKVQEIIAAKKPDTAGPISYILCYTDLCLVSYEWQFYNMSYFLKPFVKYYKHKAHLNKCIKEQFPSNPIVTHSKNDYLSGIDELNDLIKLLDKHNNYLGKNKVLSDKDLHRGYRLAQELSAISCDIQEIVYKLDKIDPHDICQIDALLRTLYGKILVCAKYSRSILDKITAKMAKYYPDWDHVVDGVPYT